MPEIRPDGIDIPHRVDLVRKVLRGFALFWFSIALVVLLTGIVDLADDWKNADNYLFVVAVIGLGIAGWLFWFLGGFVAGLFQRTEALIQNADADTVHAVGADTGTSSHRHVEIVQRSDSEDAELMVVEDSHGRMLFDSTQRPLRLVFGGFFLVVGLLIGLLMFLLSDDIGAFEYTFIIGWTALAIFAIGFVYEVTLNKRQGTADKKAGWFFIVFKRRYALRDFDRVIVESRFYRSRYSSTRHRNESPDPKFSVDLGGDRRLNLRVFSNLADAQRMGEELAAYLDLPLTEISGVH